MKGKLLGILQAVLIGLIVLSGAIAAPILCRPFYYLHIAPLNLTEAVGLSVEDVKTAYKEMMNFCIGLTDTFSAGKLAWSAEGAAHFADVQKLFVLDLRVLVISVILLLLIPKKRSARLLGHTPGFWGAVGLGATFLIVGGLAALDFDRAFVIFHQLFFPGKSNWLFDGRTDPIIYMLPIEFFRNCAIAIFGIILAACAALIVGDWKARRKK